MKKRFVLPVVIVLLAFSGISAQSYSIGKNHMICSLLMRELNSLSVIYSPPADYSSKDVSEDFETAPHLLKLHGNWDIRFPMTVIFLCLYGRIFVKMTQLKLE